MKTANAYQIDITRLFADDSSFVPFDLSNNRATLGDNAGQLTWNASKECAVNLIPPLLDSEERKEAFRDFVKQSGGWNAEEIAAWGETELNALLLQWIAGDVRESFGDDEFSEWDWAQYEKDCEAGRSPSRFFRANGAVYFDLSN